MDILLNNICKRYANKEWIIKDFSKTIVAGSRIAITGANGSGKSTLLKIIGGMVLPTSGQIQYGSTSQPISDDQLYKHINFAAPYVELIEEFTLSEFLQFHFRFKKLVRCQNIRELIDIMQLSDQEDKYIKNFSSGMKQRLKLGVSLYAAANLVLLDEPTTNLDQRSICWYMDQIKQLDIPQTLIIASNQVQEYDFVCTDIVSISAEITEQSSPNFTIH